MKLHIGCGYIKKEGFINIDKSPDVNPDMIIDIEKELPFPDNSVDEIFSNRVLEHVRPEYWSFVLDEIYRVCKNGAIIELHLPFDNVKNRCDIDHYRCFSFHSFDHCIEGNKRNYYRKFRVKMLNKKPNKFIRIICNLFPWAKDDVYFKFEVVKNKDNEIRYI